MRGAESNLRPYRDLLQRHVSAMNVGADKGPTIQRSQVMQTITTIGLDIAKSVFQVHGIDAEGNVVLRRQIKRRYVLAFFEKADALPQN